MTAISPELACAARFLVVRQVLADDTELVKRAGELLGAGRLRLFGKRHRLPRQPLGMLVVATDPVLLGRNAEVVDHGRCHVVVAGTHSSGANVASLREFIVNES